MSEPDPRTARWLTAAEAAARLGVKTETVYAYVSRGQLPRHPGPDGRTSRFLAADVDRAASRGRAGRAERERDLVVRSGLTQILDGRTVRYRGHDVADLVEEASFEQVAELLWTGDLPGAVTWTAPREALEVAGRVGSALPATATPLDRLRLTADAVAAADPLRADLRPEAVLAAARGLLATLVASLPPAGAPTPSPGTRTVEGSDRTPPRPPRRERPERAVGGGPAGLAGGLWPALSAEAPSPGLLAALDAALVLLADHELAASTLAVRVAASARCDPYAAIACGLAVVSGTRHGAAGLALEELLHDVEDPGEVGAAMARHLRHGEHLSGFGHVLYREQDPRARLLLARLRAAAAGDRRLEVVERLLALASERALPPPNIDLPLAALTYLARMPPGTGTLLFALARCAGWFAHALEQYAEPGLLRPRAVYTGP